MEMTKEEFIEIRKKLGLRRMMLASRLGGYSWGAVASWEMGKRKVPKAVAKLMRLFESTI